MPESFYQQMREPQSSFGMMHDISSHIKFTARKVQDATWKVHQALNNLEYNEGDPEESKAMAIKLLKEGLEELKKVSN